VAADCETGQTDLQIYLSVQKSDELVPVIQSVSKTGQEKNCQRPH